MGLIFLPGASGTLRRSRRGPRVRAGSFPPKPRQAPVRGTSGRGPHPGCGFRAAASQGRGPAGMVSRCEIPKYHNGKPDPGRCPGVFFCPPAGWTGASGRARSPAGEDGLTGLCRRRERPGGRDAGKGKGLPRIRRKRVNRLRERSGADMGGSPAGPGTPEPGNAGARARQGGGVQRGRTDPPADGRGRGSPPQGIRTDGPGPSPERRNARGRLS